MGMKFWLKLQERTSAGASGKGFRGLIKKQSAETHISHIFLPFTLEL